MKVCIVNLLISIESVIISNNEIVYVPIIAVNTYQEVWFKTLLRQYKSRRQLVSPMKGHVLKILIISLKRMF